MPLDIAQKNTLFDKIDTMVDGRDGKGKSAYFQALCRVLKEMSVELAREPKKVPTDSIKP